jgi:hypothetical protein
MLLRPMPARCDCGLSTVVVVLLSPLNSGGGVPGAAVSPTGRGGGNEGIKDWKSSGLRVGDAREVCVGGLGKAEYAVFAGLGSGIWGAGPGPGEADSDLDNMALLRLASEDFLGIRPPLLALVGVGFDPGCEFDGDMGRDVSTARSAHGQLVRALSPI